MLKNNHLLLFNPVSQPQTDHIKSWWTADVLEKQRILLLFWNERIKLFNEKSVYRLKGILKSFFHPHNPDWVDTIDKLFADVINGTIDFTYFSFCLKDIPPYIIKAVGEMESFPGTDITQPIETVSSVTDDDLRMIGRYLREANISAAVTLGNAAADTLITPRYLGDDTLRPFAIHSVGKLFTGMLTLLLVCNNIIPEQQLSEKICINETVRTRLPVRVQAQLDKASLFQTMTHKGGFGDYLENYMRQVSDAVQNGAAPPTINTIEDFLPFINDETYPAGEPLYSNTGILLLGFAIQHAYQRQCGACSYDDILKKYVLDPAGIKSFSVNKPHDGKFNLEDRSAAYIAGSPAGGYWMTVQDLAKFGKWMYQQCQQDTRLRWLVETYGNEFYDKNTQLISHSGGIPSSTAYLSVSLVTGNITAVLSDQPYAAFDLEKHIRRDIYGKTLNKLAAAPQNNNRP